MLYIYININLTICYSVYYWIIPRLWLLLFIKYFVKPARFLYKKFKILGYKLELACKELGSLQNNLHQLLLSNQKGFMLVKCLWVTFRKADDLLLYNQIFFAFNFKANDWFDDYLTKNVHLHYSNACSSWLLTLEMKSKKSYPF